MKENHLYHQQRMKVIFKMIIQRKKKDQGIKKMKELIKVKALKK